MEERRASNVQLAEFRAEFRAFVERFEERDKRLFGNGQPGVIQKHDDAIAEHEKTMSFYKGAIWIIGGLITLLFSGLGIHIAFAAK